jgi:hypothetical protein
MANLPSIITELEPMFPIMGVIGSMIIAMNVVFVGIKLLSRVQRINPVSVGMQFAAGALLIFPRQILETVSNLSNGLMNGLYDTASDAPRQDTPPVDAAPLVPAGPADLSWAPGVLVVAGVVAVAVVVGLGVFHYFQKSLAPSLMKSRSEKQAAATLVAEARKTLNWVVLDSASWETDLAKQIDYPTMADVSEPLVGAYIREMRQVQELERALSKSPLLAEAQAFSYAAIGLKVSYEAAVARAERVRWSNFSVDEKKRLKDARIALNVVQDSSTTPEQRNAQYKRIAKLLDGLITLTAPVKLSLASWVPMLAIETLAESGAVTVESLTGRKVPVTA